eukprot:jgi/Ulvmu1/3679/UM017_0095.1
MKACSPLSGPRDSVARCIKAASLATLLLLAAATLTSAQPSVAAVNVVASNSNDGAVNLTFGDDTRGFATIAINGRNKTIGAASSGDGTEIANSTFSEFFASFSPPLMSPPVDSDPTTGVPAPPIVSPPDGRAPPTPGPPTADEGAARLVSRIDVNGYATGAIQVFCEGAWGAVCTSNFDDVDATVACRQLGFASGVRQPQSRTFRSVDPDPAVAAPFVLENLGCDGTEGRLVDCPVFDEGTADRDFSYSFRDYTNSAICDPFAGTFAQVACGTSTAAGLHLPRIPLGFA